MNMGYCRLRINLANTVSLSIYNIAPVYLNQNMKFRKKTQCPNTAHTLPKYLQLSKNIIKSKPHIKVTQTNIAN